MSDGGADPLLDPAALALAEAALGNLAADYPRWLETDLDRALACLQAPADPKRCYAILHDIKGQAGTFGYPLVSAIAQLLCRSIQAGQDDPDVLRQGLNALRQALAQGPSDDITPDGQALLASLD
ncbi:MAG: Hpt domain-containing protein [Magnetospirillum sp.]